MPTVLTVGPYRFIFFSSDLREPPHIHVKRDLSDAKFWLDPVALAHNRGHKAHELRTIRKHVEEHREILLEAWHAYFGD